MMQVATTSVVSPAEKEILVLTLAVLLFVRAS